MSGARVGAILGCALLLVSIAAWGEGAKPWEGPGVKAGDEITGPDGGKMVWVPAGEFEMGRVDILQLETKHKVRISKGFWLGKCTVTNAQYKEYCKATGVDFPKESTQGDDHPVVEVNWSSVKAYGKHFGMRLPTEAEWEWAARGPDERKYPWGNTWDEEKCCNVSNQGPKGSTFPVGSFPAGASWCGALDMAGNVFQWCKDWYDTRYYTKSPEVDPQGPETGTYRVVRGGSFNYNEEYCRSTTRHQMDPGYRWSFTGFRFVIAP